MNPKELRQQRSRSLKGRWGQAIRSFALAILWVLFLRWAFFEPYVIPSGSMIPTLKIQDYILVNKFHYGIRLPFTDQWLWMYRTPQRGEVVVFRSEQEGGKYLVKRVVGIGGDTVEITQDGLLSVNGQVISEPTEAWMSEVEATDQVGRGRLFRVIHENWGEKTVEVLHDAAVDDHTWGPVVVPSGHMAVLGDHRNDSMDSRSWGFVPIHNVLGRASLIWWSCRADREVSLGGCSPQRLRTERIFQGVE